MACSTQNSGKAPQTTTWVKL